MLSTAATPLGELLVGDGVAYDAWARALAGGDWLGREVFYQAPLYPYFLGAVYALVGPSLLAARLVQAAIGAAGCLLVACAGKRWFDRRSGLAAGWLVALYPPAIFFDGELQKATLDLPLGAALLVLLAGLRERLTAGACVAAGAVLGLFALNRENALLLAPLLAGWLLLRSQPPVRKLQAAGAFLAGAALALTPVAARNLAVGGELVLTTAQLGPNFYIGNHAGADGRYQPLRPGRGSARHERRDATEIAEAAAGRPLTPREVSRWWLARAADSVREHPGRWLALLARKGFLTWNAREIVDTTSLEAAADLSPLLDGLRRLFHFGVLAPLAAAGLWLTRHRWRELTLLYLLLAAWSLAVAAFFVFARYRYPMVPILALFGGAAVAAVGALARRDGRPARRELLAAGALAAIVAVFCNWPADRRDPRAVTWASWGTAEAERGRPDAARRWLERALQVSPRFAEARLTLGHLKLAAGEIDAAEAEYRLVVEVDPANATAWNDLGVLADRRGDRAAAVDNFRRALAADDRHLESRYNLARAHLEGGDLAAARDEYGRLVELAPDDVEARHQLANLLAQGGDLSGAKRHYLRALEIAPDRADALFKLALVEDSLGDPAAGAAHLRRALALEPRYAERLLGHALGREQAGRVDEAQRLYRLLAEAAPGHEEATAALQRLAR